MRASSIVLGAVLGLSVIGGGLLYLQTQTRLQTAPVDSAPDTAATLIPDRSSSSTEARLKYLLFYVSGGPPEIPLGNPATIYTKAQTEKAVDELVVAIGQVGDHFHTQLGFSVGPLAFDHTDAQLRTVIADSFAVAEEKNVAVAFHIDDSMFWNARKDLWSDKNNIEWTDWNGTTRPHRIIGWVAGGKPVLAPQMCYNSPAIKAETTRRAHDVIGPAIKEGIDRLNAVGKPHLFAGIIAGWETRLQDDSNKSVNDSEPQYGFCALRNLGYSAQNPPKDMDLALQGVVSEWIILWTKSLMEGGIPKTAIYTHIGAPAPPPPFLSSSKVLRHVYKHSSANVTAFNQYSNPGFTVHGTGNFAELYKILAAHPASPWGISEGTNVNLQNSFTGGPGATGYTMEHYLGQAFNHGAVFVNLYGWNTSSTGDEFAKAAVGAEAIAAYRRFLSGGKLMEESTARSAVATTPPEVPNDLSSKIQAIQRNLPDWSDRHPDQQSTIQSLVPKLHSHMTAGNATEAGKVADEILGIMARDTPASATPAKSPDDLFSKIQRIQGNLPDWLSRHPDQQSAIQSLMPTLHSHMTAGNAAEAGKVADEILGIMGQRISTAAIAPASPKPLSSVLSSKIRKIQDNLPNWFSQHPDRRSAVQTLLPKLDGHIKAGNAKEAEKAADEILGIMGQRISTAAITPASPKPLSSVLSSKVRKIQDGLPSWFSQHPDRRTAIQTLLPKLDGHIKAGNAKEAEKAADEILSLMAR